MTYFPDHRVPRWSPRQLRYSGLQKAWHSGETPPVIASWSDKSPLLRHQTKIAGAWALGTRKGRGTVIYDATAYSNDSFALVQPYEVWVAAKFSGAYVATAVLVDGAAAPARIQRSGDALIRCYNGTNLDGTCGSSLTDRWLVLRVVVNGVSSAIYENGVLLASGNIGANDPAGLTIGAVLDGSFPSAATVGELLVTDPLTAVQAWRMTSYLLRLV